LCNSDEGENLRTTTVETSATQDEMLDFLNQMANAYGLDDEDNGEEDMDELNERKPE